MNSSTNEITITIVLYKEKTNLVFKCLENIKNFKIIIIYFLCCEPKNFRASIESLIPKILRSVTMHVCISGLGHLLRRSK